MLEGLAALGMRTALGPQVLLEVARAIGACAHGSTQCMTCSGSCFEGEQVG